MKRHALVGHLGKVEHASESSEAEVVTDVLLATIDGRIEHGVGNVLRDLRRPVHIIARSWRAELRSSTRHETGAA